MTSTMTELFGDPIYTYTRAQAVEDGYQMLLTGKDAQAAKEVGYKWPVYLTTGIVDLMNRAIENPRWPSDWDGILWDILYMSRRASQSVNEYTSKFQVIINGAGQKRYYDFVIQCGPTDIDDPAPALTIMFPEEM